MSAFIRSDGAGIQPATFHSLAADGDVATATTAAVAVATAVLFWLHGGHLFACEGGVPPSPHRSTGSGPRSPESGSGF